MEVFMLQRIPARWAAVAFAAAAAAAAAAAVVAVAVALSWGTLTTLGCSRTHAGQTHAYTCLVQLAIAV